MPCIKSDDLVFGLRFSIRPKPFLYLLPSVQVLASTLELVVGKVVTRPSEPAGRFRVLSNQTTLVSKHAWWQELADSLPILRNRDR